MEMVLGADHGSNRCCTRATGVHAQRQRVHRAVYLAWRNGGFGCVSDYRQDYEPDETMNLTEALEGKTITSVRISDGLVYLHLDRDAAVIALQVTAWGMAEQDVAPLQ